MWSKILIPKGLNTHRIICPRCSLRNLGIWDNGFWQRKVKLRLYLPPKPGASIDEVLKTQNPTSQFQIGQDKKMFCKLHLAGFTF